MAATSPGDLTFAQLVSSDMERFVDRQDAWWKAVHRGLLRPGLWASILLRAQQRLLARGHVVPAGALRSITLVLLGIDVTAGATIGPRLRLEHPSGVVIGPGVVIGADVTLMQGVSLGEKDPRKRGHLPFPVVEDGVLLGAHACVFGGVTVGEGAVVATKATVFSDVDAGATVVGTPARPVEQASEPRG